MNLDQEKAAKSAQVAKLLASGVSDLTVGKVNESVQTLQQARKLDPTNVDVIAALTRAEQARDRAAAEARLKIQTGDQLKAFSRLLGEGQTHLRNQKYAEAIASLTEALKVKENDPSAMAALAQARAGKASVQSAATKEAEAKSTAAKVRDSVAAGRTALKSNDLVAAAAALNTAKSLAPNDPDVAQALRELDSARQTADASVKKVAETKALAAKLRDAVTAGRAALKANDLAGATAAFNAAKAIAPTDTEVVQGLRDLDAARQTAETSAKKDAAFNMALAQGRKLFDAKNYPAAIDAAQQALKARPGNAAALQLLTQAQAAQVALQKSAAFGMLVAQAQKQFAAKSYAEAVQSAQEALKLQPGDAGASALLQQAQAAQTAVKDAQVVEQKRKTNYAEVVKAGQQFLAQKKFAEALQAFQAAKTLYPTDPLANQLIGQATQAWEASKKAEAPKQPEVKVPPPKLGPPVVPNADDLAKKKAADAARFQKHLADGQQAMTARRFPDAIREFEAALRLVPGDAMATQLLQKAKTAK